MRTIIAAIPAILGIILCFPYHLYISHVAKKDPQKAYLKAYGLVRRFFGMVLFLSGCKMTVIGREKIPRDEAVLFVGNHRGLFDILCCHNAFGVPLAFMSKDNIKKVPILTHYMDDMGCTYLDRTDIKKGLETILQSADIVKSGQSMMVFPEGTRNKGEELLPFKDGAYKIAQKAGVKIVPVSICGTDKMMEANKHHLIHGHRVVIEICDPISITGITPKERKAVLETIPGIIQSARDKNLPLTEKKK